MLFLPSSSLLCLYSFFPTLFTSLVLLYFLHSSDSFHFSSLYSVCVFSLSTLARSLTIKVDTGALVIELSLELILFILALISRALFNFLVAEYLRYSFLRGCSLTQ